MNDNTKMMLGFGLLAVAGFLVYNQMNPNSNGGGYGGGAGGGYPTGGGGAGGGTQSGKGGINNSGVTMNDIATLLDSSTKGTAAIITATGKQGGGLS